ARAVPVGHLLPAEGRAARAVEASAPVRTSRPLRPPTIAAPVVASAAPEPEVLVPREEIEMYRRLIAAAQNVTGAVVVESPPDIVASGSIEEITIDPIKIELMKPPIGGEGERQ